MRNLPYDSEIPLSPKRDLPGNDVALCFKVPFEFRQRFKLHALQKNLTMTELLVIAAETFMEAEQSRAASNT